MQPVKSCFCTYTISPYKGKETRSMEPSLELDVGFCSFITVAHITDGHKHANALKLCDPPHLALLRGHMSTLCIRAPHSLTGATCQQVLWGVDHI